MLFVLQFPLADSRKLLDPAHVLDVPAWPLPSTWDEFVRYFGPIRFRKRGGIIGWLGENPICEADRALRFNRDLSFPATEIAGGVSLRCAFRRFYFDGYTVGKYEVGISTKTNHRIDLSKPQTEKLLRHIFKLPVKVITPKGKAVNTELIRAGKSLAHLYQAASTRAATDDQADWLVQAGIPVLYLELPYRDQFELPYQVKDVPLLQALGFQLSHGLVHLDGMGLHVWALNCPDQLADESKIRALRMYLLRLHAEHECLRLMLRNVGRGKLTFDPRSESSGRLQNYFDLALKRIGRLEKKSRDFDAEIIELARQSFYVADPGQQDALVSQLDSLDVRGQLLRNLKRFIAQQDTHSSVVVNDHNSGGVRLTATGDIKIGGDVVTGDKIVIHLQDESAAPGN